MASPPPPIAELIAAADRHAAARDFVSARAALKQALATARDDVELWLKLSAMCRADGDLNGALAAIGGALRVDPLHFLALMIRANILEQRGDDSAGEAYGRALAQRPDGAVPPSLERMIDHAQRHHRADCQARLAGLESTAAPIVARASPDEAARAARFMTNALRITRPYHSEPTHYHYPGLAEREFHDRADFPWLDALEAATDAIAADFARVVAAEHAGLVPYIQYPDDVPLRQWAELNHNPAWSAIHLWQNGRRVEANARHCAATMAAIADLPMPAIAGCSPNAMFSLLAPGAHIPPHVGVANTRLVCHLPLIVPDGCWFRVGAQTRPWRRGEALLFDDTIEHEARNESDALRVVFIVDIWHPGLRPIEREAVTALMAAQNGGSGGSGGR